MSIPVLVRRATLALVGVGLVALTLTSGLSEPPSKAVLAAEGIPGMLSMAAGQATVGTPTRVVTQALSYPPVRTAEQQAATEEFMARAERAWDARAAAVIARASARAGLAAPLEVAAPPENAATSAFADLQAALDPVPAAPNSFEIHLRSDLAPPLGYASSVNEPAVAQSGRYIFYTHNWYAARSYTHAAGTLPWIYINPYADFSDFCCDQDVIYDKGRDIFIWERMGISPVGVQNQFKLGISSDGGASFCTYSFFPSNIGRPDGFWDYPRMSLSNDWLYITWNMFGNVSGFIGNVLLKMPLDQLSSCSGFTYFFWFMPDDGWSPAAVENATETMYLGDNPVLNFPVNNAFRVLWNDEDSNTLFWVTRTIAPYDFTNRNGAVCRVPGGANPCARADQRVIGGVLAKGQLDFFWNVQQGRSFAYPYVESAGFDEATLTYNARKLVFNQSYAWFYAAVGADDRDHVGMSVMWFPPEAQPGMFVGIDDDYNPAPPGWEVALAKQGTQNWTSNASGDYLRARTSGPQGVGWVGTGYTRQMGMYEPFFVEWRRGRDVRGMRRYQLR